MITHTLATFFVIMSTILQVSFSTPADMKPWTVYSYNGGSTVQELANGGMRFGVKDVPQDKLAAVRVSSPIQKDLKADAYYLEVLFTDDTQRLSVYNISLVFNRDGKSYEGILQFRPLGIPSLGLDPGIYVLNENKVPVHIGDYPQVTTQEVIKQAGTKVRALFDTKNLTYLSVTIDETFYDTQGKVKLAVNKYPLPDKAGINFSIAKQGDNSVSAILKSLTLNELAGYDGLDGTLAVVDSY